MSNLPVLKPQEVVQILENLGFVEVRQKGSHKQFRQTERESIGKPVVNPKAQRPMRRDFHRESKRCLSCH